MLERAMYDSSVSFGCPCPGSEHDHSQPACSGLLAETSRLVMSTHLQEVECRIGDAVGDGQYDYTEASKLCQTYAFVRIGLVTRLSVVSCSALKLCPTRSAYQPHLSRYFASSGFVGLCVTTTIAVLCLLQWVMLRLYASPVSGRVEQSKREKQDRSWEMLRRDRTI